MYVCVMNLHFKGVSLDIFGTRALSSPPAKYPNARKGSENVSSVYEAVS